MSGKGSSSAVGGTPERMRRQRANRSSSGENLFLLAAFPRGDFEPGGVGVIASNP